MKIEIFAAFPSVGTETTVGVVHAGVFDLVGVWNKTNFDTPDADTKHAPIQVYEFRIIDDEGNIYAWSPFLTPRRYK